MKQILKNTWAVLDKKEKKQFGILIMLDIFISIADIIFLALLLWILRFYMQPTLSVNLYFLPAWLANRNSVLLIAVFVVFFSLKNRAAFFITRGQFTFISKLAIRLSHYNLANYQHGAFEEFVNTDSSVHMRNTFFRPFEFCQYMLSGIQQTVTQLTLILLSIIAIILFNANLFLLLLLILLPPVIIVFYFIKKRLTKAKKHIQTSNEKSFQYLTDALKGYVEGNVYDRNEFFMNRFISTRKEFSSYLFDSLALQTIPGRTIEIFAVLGLFILILIAQWSGHNDNTTLITIGAFMAAAYKIIPGIVKVINISGQLRAYEFSLKDISQIKNNKGPLQGKNPVDDLVSMELNNIYFKYPGQQVLTDFSLTINKGDFIGITGESGKGKTTILNILLGFLPAQKGEILFNNKTINRDELINCRSFIAYVRQQAFFIHDTLLRNIILEEELYNKENLEYALEVSGINEFIAKFPEGQDKLITENGKNISGGQQQRIAIARALYKNASLILLDEPFNELDETSAKTILIHLNKLCATGKTIIMITHDKKSLSFCNKIISLDEN